MVTYYEKVNQNQDFMPLLESHLPGSSVDWLGCILLQGTEISLSKVGIICSCHCKVQRWPSFRAEMIQGLNDVATTKFLFILLLFLPVTFIPQLAPSCGHNIFANNCLHISSELQSKPPVTYPSLNQSAWRGWH